MELISNWYAPRAQVLRVGKRHSSDQQRADSGLQAIRVLRNYKSGVERIKWAVGSGQNQLCLLPLLFWERGRTRPQVRKKQFTFRRTADEGVRAPIK